MNKNEFLAELKMHLSGLSETEKDKILAFYAESIDDRVESGITQEKAVQELGDINVIVQDIMADMPYAPRQNAQNTANASGMPYAPYQNAQNTANASGMPYAPHQNAQASVKSESKIIWIILAVLGIPIWLPIIISVMAVIFAVFISIWATVVSLYSLPIAFALTALGLLVFCGSLFAVNVYSGFAAITFGIFLMGLAIISAVLMVFITKQAAKLTMFISKKIMLLFKKKV